MEITRSPVRSSLLPACIWKSSAAAPQLMKTLLLSNWSLPAARDLANAATARGWSVSTLQRPPRDPNASIVFYGSTLDAIEVTRNYGIALLEPPLDILTTFPKSLLLRDVEFSRWEDLPSNGVQRFIKPADPLNKVFDAGTYSSRNQIRTTSAIPNDCPVLIAEPVELLAEYRCFILNRRLATWSPYLSFGRPLAHHRNATSSMPPSPVLWVCEQLFTLAKLPPAFVVDVGLIEDRGWAIVEFNPVWCSGLLSASAEQVLPALERCSRKRDGVTFSDRQWIVSR